MGSVTAYEENAVWHPAQYRHNATTHLLKHYAEHKPFMDALRRHVATHRAFYRAAIRANIHPDGYTLPMYDGPFQWVRDARYDTDYRRQFRADLAAIVHAWGLTQPPDPRRADDVDFAARIEQWCQRYAWRDGEHEADELWRPGRVWVEPFLPQPGDPDASGHPALRAAPRITVTIETEWRADLEPWEITRKRLEAEFNRQATAERERIVAAYQSGGWMTARGAYLPERDSWWLFLRLKPGPQTPEMIEGAESITGERYRPARTIKKQSDIMASLLELTIP